MKPSKKTAAKRVVKKRPAKRAVRRTKGVGGDTPRGMLIMKLKKLGTAIEMKKGVEMDIDDPHYRWVDDRINYLESEGRKLSKEEMVAANDLWRIYG